MSKETLNREDDDFISTQNEVKIERNYRLEAKMLAKKSRNKNTFSSYKKYLKALFRRN